MLRWQSYSTGSFCNPNFYAFLFEKGILHTACRFYDYLSLNRGSIDSPQGRSDFPVVGLCVNGIPFYKLKCAVTVHFFLLRTIAVRS